MFECIFGEISKILEIGTYYDFFQKFHYFLFFVKYVTPGCQCIYDSCA